MTPFPTFSEETFFKDIKEWIESGGDAKAISSQSNWSLLHLAAEFQDIAAIEYLINLGCDPNLPDVYGQTPLHIAISIDIDAAIQNDQPLEYKATKKFIELGADITVKENQGKTPIDWVDCYGEVARKMFDDLFKTKLKGVL